MKFLGIDGGGTKTEFVIIDEKGNILGHVIKPTCHYKQTSLENFRGIIREGVKDVCRQVSINVKDIKFSFLGIPGYGEISDDIPKIERIIEEILGSSSYEVANDAVIAWAGSLGARPGINIVAGTGAIGFGMDVNGDFARTGGWGHHCGDEGSAYWLGKKLIEVFGKESDGRLQDKTPLYHILRSDLNIQKDFDLIHIVVNEYGMQRDKIAGLAKILYKAAEEKDLIAIDIFAQAAYEHYLMIRSLRDKLYFPRGEKIYISYSGGVFNAGKYVLEPLKEYLSELNKNIELIRPILKPVSGAVLYATKLYFNEIRMDIIEKLKSEEIRLNIR